MTCVSTGLRGGCTSEPDGVLCGCTCCVTTGFLISPVVLTLGGLINEPDPGFGAAGNEPEPGLGAFVSEPEPGLGAGLISTLSSTAGDGNGLGAGCGADSVLTAGCGKGFRANSGLVELRAGRGNCLVSDLGASADGNSVASDAGSEAGFCSCAGCGVASLRSGDGCAGVICCDQRIRLSADSTIGFGSSCASSGSAFAAVGCVRRSRTSLTLSLSCDRQAGNCTTPGSSSEGAAEDLAGEDLGIAAALIRDLEFTGIGD